MRGAKGIEVMEAIVLFKYVFVANINWWLYVGSNYHQNSKMSEFIKKIRQKDLCFFS